MSHGIKKETYVDADEKTTKAMTYDLLDNLYTKMDDTAKLQVKQVENCDKRFTTIEKKKRRDTVVSTASGFGGGGVAVLLIWLKSKFGG